MRLLSKCSVRLCCRLSLTLTDCPAHIGHEPAFSPILKVGFVSLGCAKNMVDTQVMAGVILAEGCQMAPSPDQADVVVVNTCAFIGDARVESLDAIRCACAWKQKGICRAVIVTGCMPQRYRDRYQAMLPGVDAWLGVDALDRIGQVVRRVVAGERGVLEVVDVPVRLFDPPRLPGVVLSRGAYAYLKVAEGCNHRCAFCAIPGIRGRYRSRSLDRIVLEAQHLLQSGFREINLVSQDTLSYGRDRGDQAGMIRLIQELGKLPGNFWIRILYGYPSRATPDLLRVMADVPAVCRYLDLPIQHRDPVILKAMRRAETVDFLDDLVPRLRTALPGVVIRTTCLVGFPGETEEAFENLLRYIRESGFDHMGVFVYSPETGTPAYDLPDPVPPSLAEERKNQLLEVQSTWIRKRFRDLAGREDDVLVELVEGKGCSRNARCRSRGQAPDVDGSIRVVSVPASWTAGQFVRIRYTGARAGVLMAKPV